LLGNIVVVAPTAYDFFIFHQRFVINYVTAGPVGDNRFYHGLQI